MGRSCVLIIGMHRSGTSALAGMLHRCGLISMGRTLLEAAFDNPKGFFESKKITDFNNQVLLPNLNRNWMSISSYKPGWENADELRPLYEKARRCVEEEFLDVNQFGIKAPCFLLGERR